MARNGRKKKRITTAKPGVEVVLTNVADPYDGKPLTVAKNARVHPLDQMQARGRLTDAQKAAGDRFLAIYDRSQIGGARAIDYSQLKVDVSFVHRGLDPSVMAATNQMTMICQAVGRRAYKLLVLVIGQRHGIFDLARRLDGTVDRPHAEHLSRSFKESLDDLADHFGVAKGRNGHARPYTREIKPFVGKIDLGLVTELTTPALRAKP